MRGSFRIRVFQKRVRLSPAGNVGVPPRNALDGADADAVCWHAPMAPPPPDGRRPVIAAVAIVLVVGLIVLFIVAM